MVEFLDSLTRTSRQLSLLGMHQLDFIKYTTHSVGDLVECLYYEFRLIAENEAGISKASASSQLVTAESKVTDMAPVIVEPLSGGLGPSLPTRVHYGLEMR